MESLVSTQWLADNLEAPSLRVIDATRHHFEPERSSSEEFESSHIPGALFLDMVTLVDAASPIENTAPTPEFFAQRMCDLGLTGSEQIVLYDDSIVKTATRAWFLFKAYGWHNVAVLDGGLKKWKAEGRPLTSEQTRITASNYTANADSGFFRTKADVLANIETGAEQLVDGRGAAHFTGQDDDPNPVVAAGHVPGAINVPFWDLFEADGTYKDADALRAAFNSAGVDLTKPVITSCGSGVVACALALALDRLGKTDVALYDGSWTEWGADPALPKARG